MGKGNNEKYNRKEFEKIITGIGFSPTGLGKGDHIVWEHKIYKDLKLVIPTHRELGDNAMTNIGSNLIIAMYILGEDISIFKHKEGIEGKLKNIAGKIKKDNLTALFTPTARKCLGLNDDNDILEYIKNAKRKVINQANSMKR